MNPNAQMIPKPAGSETRVTANLPIILVADLGDDCGSYEDINFASYVRGGSFRRDSAWLLDQSPTPASASHFAARPEPDIIIDPEPEPEPQTGPDLPRRVSFAVTHDRAGWHLELFVSNGARAIIVSLILAILLAAMGKVGEALEIVTQFLF